MALEAASDTTLRDVYRALVRHRGKASLFFVATMTVTLLATILVPRSYLSESKLFIRLGRENVTLDATATLGNDSVVVTPSAREDEINSVAAMLGSRVMLERVVDSLGPDLILGSGAQTEPIPGVQHAGTTAPGATTASRLSAITSGPIRWARQTVIGEEPPIRDRALRHLTQRLKVGPMRRSNIVEITYEAPAPELAQTVVATLIDAYLDEHARLNRLPGSHRFFNEQADRLRVELAAFEEELAALKTTTGLAAIDEQRDQLITRMGRLQDDLLAAESNRIETEARVLALRKKLAESPKERVSETTEGVNDAGTDGIRQQFFALQTREKQAAAIYTDSHPKLQAIRDELAAAKAIHDQEERTRVEVRMAPDSMYEQIRLALADEEPALDSLTARSLALKQQLAAARRDLDALTARETEIAKLQREIELREADYRKYAVNLEQARIDDSLESQRMSNINVVQPASYDARPVRPRAMLNLALGLLVGLFGAFGIALFAEYADHSFRTPEDIERNLDLPALVAIPRMSRETLPTSGRD